MYKKYNIQKEYLNIENYSPFSHINEVSPKFRRSPFKMPFVFRSHESRPVHPDTFTDLNLNLIDIIDEKEVFPTSSFRTVYDPEENVCYKVPLLRTITRGLRDLPHKELQRSQKASDLLSSHKLDGFDFLPEECHYANNPVFNYIKRSMPDLESFPWFYVIASQDFDKEFEINATSKIIKSWMFFASKGIFLEYHTQNILVDKESNIIYRDLSDIKSNQHSLLSPSYYDSLLEKNDILATIFDRTVCNQNLDHLFKYSKKLGDQEYDFFKSLIESEIEKYNLPFPKYSMDFPIDKPQRIPEKTQLVHWRNFE
jgi:hypothetical protein